MNGGALPNRARRLVGDIAIALGAAALALGLRWGLSDILHSREPYAIMFMAVLVVGLARGFWPGLITLLICLPTAEYYFDDPPYSLALLHGEEQPGLLLELTIGLAILLVSARYRKSRAHAHSAELMAAEVGNKLTLIANNTSDVVFAYDMQRRLIYVNPAFEKLTGYTVAQLRQDHFIDYVHPDDAARMRALMDDAFAGDTFSDVEFRIITRGGRVKWCLSSWGPLFDLQGAQIGIQGREHDITARKLAEQAHFDSEERFSLAARASNNVIWDWNVAADTLVWHHGAGGTFGYDCSLVRISRQWWSQRLHPHDRQRVLERLEAAIHSGSQHWSDEYRFQCADGSYSDIVDRAFIVRTSQDSSALESASSLGAVGTPALRAGSPPGSESRATSTPVRVIGAMQDVTERKSFEKELAIYRDHLEELVRVRTVELEKTHERLRLSERMAALGTLAAGLGHDLGNLLLPLKLRLDAMQIKGLPQSLRDDVDAIGTSAEYLQRLTNGLRMLALDPDEDDASGESTDLAQWSRDVRPFLRHALPRNVTFELDIPGPPASAGLPRVKLARHRLTQAIFNLVQNAGNAMQRRAGVGTPALRAGSVAAATWESRATSKPHVRVWARLDELNHQVVVGVTDNGPGMTPQIKRRCLEPFFTTRTRGISTGLGLALVHGIVRRAGGSIEIESTLGQGTTFTMCLPCEHQEPATAPAEPSPMPQQPIAAIAIRDAQRRAYLGAMLATLGFQIAQDPDSNGSDGTYQRTATHDVRECFSDAQLLVVDTPGHNDHDVRAFIEADPDRYVVIFGEGPGSINGSRIITLPHDPKPAAIWQALRPIAQELCADTAKPQNVISA